MVAGGLCRRCRRPGHRAADCPEARRPHRRPPKCFRCGQRGHIAGECRRHHDIKVEKHADDQRSAAVISDFTLEFKHQSSHKETPPQRPRRGPSPPARQDKSPREQRRSVRRAIERAINRAVDTAVTRALAEVSARRLRPLVSFIEEEKKEWGTFQIAPKPSRIQHLRWKEHKLEAETWKEIASGKFDVNNTSLLIPMKQDNTPLLMPVAFGTVFTPQQQ